MKAEYEEYCHADAWFYESPTRVRGDDVDFDLAQRPAPDGWTRSELDDWLVYRPDGLRLPTQGWKIHASACLDDAEAVLAASFDYCRSRGIAFKFIRSRQLLFMRNAKYADRGASGKFITIYPAGDAALELILTELGAELEGRQGPSILSDLRWGRTPLHVRYGGFAERYCVGAAGDLELAIADPTGRLVPDRRGPTFQLPTWITLPDFLAPHLAARNSVTMEGLPYRIERALHFSNGGGLYGGVDLRTGDHVVFKEARPHAGLASDGADAVTRLGREHDVLERLAGLDVVPAVRDHFTVGDHHFLVLDYVDGTALSALLVERYPLTLQEIDDATAAEYAAWALDMHGRVEAAVAAIHERGIVIGDLHPYNVLVRPDGRVALIDFEVAADVAEGRRPTLADPGFAPPPDRTGFDIDRYALACMRLFMFLPLTTLFGLSRDKAGEMADEIGRIFTLPQGFLAEAVRVIGGTNGAGGGRLPRPRLEPDQAGWVEARDSMVRAILSSATPHRSDRLFPGDIRQFEGVAGGLDLGHGAAGVLYALAAAGAGRFPEHEEWLASRALRPQPGTPLGFYDGLHGIAHALDSLDRRGEALEVLSICEAELAGRVEHLGLDLHSGLAGIGLNLAHFATVTGDAAMADAAVRVAGVVADRLGDETDVAETSGGAHPHAGLLRGSSGPALLFLRLHERSGDPALLDLAAIALRQDLRRCILRDDGSLEVNEGWRTMPYLADGSVGIGLVLDEYLAHREDERFTAAAAAIRRAAEAQFYIEPGLFYGRAGMILHLSRRHAPGTAASDPVIAAQVRRLNWHALSYRDDLAFPGEQLLRLSMDLATGTAGVLLALSAALSDTPRHLPFLGRLERPRRTARLGSNDNHTGRR